MVRHFINLSNCSAENVVRYHFVADVFLRIFRNFGATIFKNTFVRLLLSTIVALIAAGIFKTSRNCFQNTPSIFKKIKMSFFNLSGNYLFLLSCKNITK